MGHDGTYLCTDYDAVRLFTRGNTSCLSYSRLFDKHDNAFNDLFRVNHRLCAKYDKKMGIGTMISVMIPYSMFFLISWTIMLIVWILFGLDLGINAPIYYP